LAISSQETIPAVGAPKADRPQSFPDKQFHMLKFILCDPSFPLMTFSWMRHLLSLGLFFAASLACHSQTNNTPAISATNRYELRKDHDPNGIGKFYMGREIAHVMGHQAADWLERPERQQEERPDLLMGALKLRLGDAVADIGAGTGYYTRRLAKLVGDKGAVYAVEIQQEMLDLLTNKMAQLNINNVKPVLGTITDPKLPTSSLDVIFMVDVYHEFDFPYEMVESMCRSLKSGGRMVFVEFRGEDPKVPIKLVHKMTEAQVRKEMSIHPLQWVETIETLPWQHIIVFRRK
jgi:ubiquinone/menaquinone biosynthesis C-methylase UbiE